MIVVVAVVIVVIVGPMTIIAVRIADPPAARTIVVAAIVTHAHAILVPVVTTHAIAIAEAVTTRFDGVRRRRNCACTDCTQRKEARGRRTFQHRLSPELAIRQRRRTTLLLMNAATLWVSAKVARIVSTPRARTAFTIEN